MPLTWSREITGIQSFVPRDNDLPEAQAAAPQPAKELATAE